VAKVKIINPNLDQNLNGVNFNNTTSNVIFSFGKFNITTNFDGRNYIDYTNKISGFAEPISLEYLGIDDNVSNILNNDINNIKLNLDKSDLKKYVRFGSSREFLKSCIEEIILSYPGSLFVDSVIERGGNLTYFDFNYNSLENVSTFKIPSTYIVNKFNLIFNLGNNVTDVNNKNINLSYGNYVIYSENTPSNGYYNLVGFTGDSYNTPYIKVIVNGNPFPSNSGETIGYFNFHIKPNNDIFEDFRTKLSDFSKYIISQRDGFDGFKFKMKDPTLLDDGNVRYGDLSLLWNSGDGYNIDYDGTLYVKFLDSLLTIGEKYDAIKTDLIARFLTPLSIKTYDLTNDGKITKLLRVYGREFDVLKTFIDSLQHVNKLSYDKLDNLPDQVVSKLSKTFGWDYFSLVNENELVKSFFNVDDSERNLNRDLLPPEIDIELWRRILINTNYFWKSKGTRESIKSIFKLIGIPEPFINITEYVYTVDGRIDPRDVTLSIDDFPTKSLPYNNDGYPVAPFENKNFYFQMSGDTDSGQAYLDVFRSVGFNLSKTIDNKKSWVNTGETIRNHYNMPDYYQSDNKLIINTKEIDITLDAARGVEYDIYTYIKEVDYPANSSDFIVPYTYVNLSLGYNGNQNTFTLPFTPEGDFEVRYNGILLNAPKTGTSYNTNNADYVVSGNSFVLNENAINSNNRRDIVQVTYLYSGGTTQPISGISIQYVVTRVNANINGTIIDLPQEPKGDVQLSVNGIALTKGTPQFIADYIIDVNNPSRLIIQNQDLIGFLSVNPNIQLAYVTVTGSTSIESRNEVYRIDSFNSSKLYFNEAANKYVFKLNYKIKNANEVKILIDGISLEPNTDYSVNTGNLFEIFLPNGLKYGSVISAYYLIGGNEYSNPIIGNQFNFGDISKMSFLEFIEKVQSNLINVRNRKIVSNYNGGWYPTLLRIYEQYIKRSELSNEDTLKSNGYTFNDLFLFLNKYNTFFDKFVNQLIPMTSIVNKRGLLVRNSVFTRQKFQYKRGVYMGIIDNDSVYETNFLNDVDLKYLGDDGSVFIKRDLISEWRWDDNYVCVDDLCKNFIISGVTITYPFTTTTTTASPYNFVLFINELSSIQRNPSGIGWFVEGEYEIKFNPTIPFNYSINLRFNLNSDLNIDHNGVSSSSNVIIKNNGSVVREIRNNKSILTQPSIYSDVIKLNMGALDNYTIKFENFVLNPPPSLPTGNSYSKTTLSDVVINSVSPNGEVLSISPSEIINETPIL